ncbi:unnamed protein product [Parnassius apollo]|uniref:(apollo) hypothetical protein n=1 Tax=Parnassius apollo TaxID=110799 RepID=A0A8S3WIH2_PARAO|nr:unnamed protein product [Parnassius apollo]
MWEGISLKTMTDAAKEEREFALLQGRIDENGVPIIDVIVDGCWSKRSYRKNYSALLGAAVIIGKKTEKILLIEDAVQEKKENDKEKEIELRKEKEVKEKNEDNENEEEKKKILSGYRNF